ncbi:hypothetical protein [Virgibacillus chiguensis]
MTPKTAAARTFTSKRYNMNEKKFGNTGGTMAKINVFTGFAPEGY